MWLGECWQFRERGEDRYKDVREQESELLGNAVEFSVSFKPV